MPDPPLRPGEEEAVGGLVEEHLRDAQAEELGVGDLRLATALAGGLVGRKLAGGAVDCDEKGVEVGGHGDLQVGVGLTSPTFGALFNAPWAAVNSESII
jgi:hypothetical protein